MKNTKKKLYRVKYYFDGKGYVDIKAKNEKEAEDLFFKGDFDNQNEWGESYEIEEIEKDIISIK